MKITETQLRKGIRQMIREQVGQRAHPWSLEDESSEEEALMAQDDMAFRNTLDQMPSALNPNDYLDGDAYQQGFEDGEAGVGPADSNDKNYMMGWNAGTDNASGGYNW